jgi:hypothetical protein
MSVEQVEFVILEFCGIKDSVTTIHQLIFDMESHEIDICDDAIDHGVVEANCLGRGLETLFEEFLDLLAGTDFSALSHS